MLIGVGVKIFGNIEIGEGLKVGVGSVVFNSVLVYVIVVGVLVKVVGRLVC